MTNFSQYIQSNSTFLSGILEVVVFYLILDKCLDHTGLDNKITRDEIMGEDEVQCVIVGNAGIQYHHMLSTILIYNNFSCDTRLYVMDF